jgi:molybdopterin-guanine dinucleotide biosynthesis protein A
LLLQNFAQNDRVEVEAFSAVLLAGGESRRMGRDKATIEFDGRPLWERQLEIRRALRPAMIFVSARITPLWLPADTELLLDDPPSRGPLSGLTKALAAMQTTHLLALAVDMPFVTIEPLRSLCRLARAGQGVVPMIRDQAEPLAAIYPAEAAVHFAAALAGKDFSLQRIIQKLAAEEKIRLFALHPKDESLYRSVNEPDDLKERRFTNRPPK